MTWLLDVLPADYRVHGVLRRHPVALAAVARHYLDACVAGARSGYRAARTELSGALPPQAVEAVLQVYQDEGRRLVDAARAVDLLGRALRGETFTPALAEGRAPRPATAQRSRRSARGASQLRDTSRARLPRAVRSRRAPAGPGRRPAGQAGTGTAAPGRLRGRDRGGRSGPRLRFRIP